MFCISNNVNKQDFEVRTVIIQDEFIEVSAARLSANVFVYGVGAQSLKSHGIGQRLAARL